jgi:hypothetical protein
VAGQSDVDAVTTDLSNHSGSSSGVHGVGASNVESVSGAQSKADSAESSANTYTDDHEAKNNPHSASASDTDLSNHANDGTNPHGVSASQTGALASSDYNPEADTHSKPTNSEIQSAVYTVVASGTVNVGTGLYETAHLPNFGRITLYERTNESSETAYLTDPDATAGEHMRVFLGSDSNDDLTYQVVKLA